MTVIAEVPVNTPAAWTLRAENEPTSWGAAGWSEDSQRDRIVKALDELHPQRWEKILDYGSGTGELCRYLAADVLYVGVDTSPGMVARARLEYPDRQFQTWEPNPLRCDLTICLGPWNLADNWSKGKTYAALRRLWDGTTRALVASLYAGDDLRCLRYTEGELEGFASRESYNWSVERWRPNDLLMVLDRDPRKRVF